jgi:hypothetical protein
MYDTTDKLKQLYKGVGKAERSALKEQIALDAEKILGLRAVSLEYRYSLGDRYG